jgi:hypothetical protein
MYIIYKSVDDFTNIVRLGFILSRTFFGDIYKFLNGSRNIKNINKQIINMKNMTTKTLQI